MSSQIEKALRQIQETADILSSRGWAEATAGNMSVRLETEVPIQGSGNYILNSKYPTLAGSSVLITSSGSRMRHIASKNPEDHCVLISISPDGSSYTRHGANGSPSSELEMHLLIHDHFAKNSKEINSVIHAHPDAVIALMHLNRFKTADDVSKLLFEMHTEAELLIPEGVGLTGVKKPGSSELAQAVLEQMKTHSIVFMEKHGCISSGISLDEALDKIEFVNKAAEIYFRLNNSEKK